ncbi:two pore domain potassium channel family protein [Occultella glacieicola]|uniref:Two pore domain potassium channel family protein n=1 Tax=Occultella glacieicola TaxID=2518684 RepID=A0ABY2E8K9_9MICO|nr:potassium channel family protein [Occultella glacieicola]TDE98822.1 two pore domain potassium channel family protein [Occultella glacieicola]
MREPPPERARGADAARVRGTSPWVLVRPALSAAAVLVVYYALPLGRTSAGTLILLGLGLIALGGMLTWQIRAIARSRRPGLRAIEALATAVPFFLVMFAALYVGMSRSAPASFSEALDRTDALYFTVTVFATVGFGDIAPVAEVARIAVMVQMLTGMVLLGGVLKLVLGAVRVGLSRAPRESSEASEPAVPDEHNPAPG